jgi:hypothetical protein
MRGGTETAAASKTSKRLPKRLFPMISFQNHLKKIHIRQLQGTDSCEAARRYIVGIRQALKCPDVLLCHLADY